MGVFSRVKNAWNAFSTNDKAEMFDFSQGVSTSSRPDRPRRMFSNERSIISSIYTHMSIDVASVAFRHVVLDEIGRFKNDVNSEFNKALNLEPNMDQGPRAFRQEIALTLFEHGVAAIVPVDTTFDPAKKEDFDVLTLRVGTIVKWFPKHVRISLYNEEKGRREEVTLQKRSVAIVENPLYNVMNEPNSTLQRLIVKLNTLDAIDEQSSSGKLDIIIQLPYVVKTDQGKLRAEQRRKDIEFQLKGSKYGIAYTDGSEKITQLNRPAENNLLGQVEFLVKMLYEQLGLTEAVMSGTADEAAMINYFTRSVEPVLDAISEGLQRALLGPIKTGNKERIKYFRDPFKLVPMKDIAEIADKLTRNEILTSNEVRGALGLPPSTDPKADELRNSNMPQPINDGEVIPTTGEEVVEQPTETEDGAAIDLVNEQLDELIKEVEGGAE